ncbi:MAG TPA: efflux transporter outer membrane subunit [Stellaceae bacterium]|jgi:NodT family efflux transporter outer membrane factor (OMF) lipoprotein|nr:efflux transporter outer membrane subunit [Stellaceae bacterium]
MIPRIWACALAVLVSACGAEPPATPPPPAPDAGYAPGGGAPTIPSVGSAGVDQHFALGKDVSGEWWGLFHSPALDELLAQAVAGNRNLAAAHASLAAAHDAVMVAAGGFYPQVDFGGGAERQRNNFKAVGLTGFPPKEFNVYSFGPTVSYTFNPAGLTTHQVEHEQALEDVQSHELTAAYLALTGSAVTEAITIASFAAQIKEVDDMLADDQQNLRLVKDEVTAGAGTELDIETANSQLAADRTLLPPLRQQLSVAQHALAVLVGKSPANWTPPAFALEQLTLPVELPVSLPSALAHQRPDILAAEAQLHVASAAVGVANAQLYPQLTLSADVMQQFLKPDTIFDPMSNIWSIGMNLAAPIFHGGSLHAQKREAEDTYEATLASYEQTVLSAFGQVADTLDGLAHDSEQLAAEQAAYQSADATVRLTRTSYSLGNASLLQVLDAQRQLQQARLGLARAEAQRYLDSAQLFVALGGGWWNNPPPGAVVDTAAPANVRP